MIVFVEYEMFVETVVCVCVSLYSSWCGVQRWSHRWRLNKTSATGIHVYIHVYKVHVQMYM